jgi:hypothetical protein
MTHTNPTPEDNDPLIAIGQHFATFNATPHMQANWTAALNFILSTMVLAAPTNDQPEEIQNEQDPE